MMTHGFTISGVLAGYVFGLGAAAEAGSGDHVTKYARFQAGGGVFYGIVEGERLRRISGDLFGDWSRTDETFALSDVRLLVPTTPRTVVAVIGNYRSHLGTQPASSVCELFFKPSSCLLAHGQDIRIPPGTNDVHPEGELVIVIGRRAQGVSPDEAMKHVFGITCGNDVSARDWQQNDRQWWRAKGSDTFGPCGPFIVAGLASRNLQLEVRVNGVVKQRERTDKMIHSVPQIVSWVSRHVTLEPGDLIFTGTPGTTSAVRPGDVVEVELEGVGVLRNGVKASAKQSQEAARP